MNVDDPSGNSMPTVLVQAAAGPMRINRADYDSNPDAWTLVDESGDRKSTATLVADDDSDLTDAERARAAELGVLIGGNWKPATARRKIAEAEEQKNAKGGKVEYDVIERDGRHFVVDKLTGVVQLDPAGYDTAVAAWGAATA